MYDKPIGPELPAELRVCPISLEDIEWGEATNTPCGHSYKYKADIVKWVVEHFSCPACRREIYVQELTDDRGNVLVDTVARVALPEIEARGEDTERSEIDGIMREYESLLRNPETNIARLNHLTSVLHRRGLRQELGRVIEAVRAEEPGFSDRILAAYRRFNEQTIIRQQIVQARLEFINLMQDPDRDPERLEQLRVLLTQVQGQNQEDEADRVFDVRQHGVIVQE